MAQSIKEIQEGKFIKMSPEEMEKLGENQSEPLICNVCGHVMVRCGAAHRCMNCGNAYGM
jgi:rubrerythrin